MKQILIATHNKGKLAEFTALLQPLGYKILSAADFSLPEPDETANSFAGNARLKAVAAAKAAGIPAIADDSGLCVAAMRGAPGIFSSRYAGTDYPGAFARIVAACTTASEWRAWFICALSLSDPDGSTQTFLGRADGTIAKAPAGIQGFGYDPIFVPDGFTQTYAALGGTIKARLSHRARAVAQLTKMLGG